MGALNFTGTCKKFKFRYVTKELDNLNLNKFSDIQVILDFRSLHNSLIDSYRWIGKIEKLMAIISVTLEPNRLPYNLF